MPHAQVKLSPGIDQNETPALNQAGISSSQLIRFIPDRNGLGLVQKLGGWAKFYATAISTPVRAIWAWDDTNSVIHLAYGSTNNLSVITNNVSQNITPTYTTDNVTPYFNTVLASSTVAIQDTVTTGITSACSVYIQTHVSVGGLILFGLYQCSQQSNTYYSITSTDIFGNLLPATSTVTGGGVVAKFSTTSGSATILVTLPNHGFSVGATYPALVSTTVGGLTIYGNYVIQSTPDANTFTIKANSNATSTVSNSPINGGNVALLYSYAVGPVLPGTGYGIGGYGSGGYGFGSTITPSTGSATPATDWTLDNYGQQLVAVPINGTAFQPVYVWDPTSGAPYASVIPQAPALNDGVFVAMPQRQLVTWGSTFTGVQDPLLVRWSDIGNYNVWVGTPTNQAGSYRIPRGSKIVGAMQAPHQGLIWTDLDLWAMQYINLPNVYGFQQLGSGCGLIARKAAGVVQGAVVWMSQSQFFKLAGDGIAPIFCPVWDVVFQALDLNNLQKIRAAVNSRFNEITWYYPTTSSFTGAISGTTLSITAGTLTGVIGPGAALSGAGVTAGTTIVSGGGLTWTVSQSQTVAATVMSTGGENTSYVKYNVGMEQWDFGVLTRTAWTDQSVLGPPIGAGPNPATGLNYIYQHETAPDADGSAMLSSFTTGYFAIGDGDNKTFIDQVWPDMKWGYYGSPQSATVQITFNVTDYPGDTPVAYGPYSVTQATEYFTTRFRGRLVSLTVSSSDTGSFWRLGGIRYRFQPDGKF